MAKEEALEGDVKFGRAGHQQGTQLNGEVISCRFLVLFFLILFFTSSS